uniref:SWIM-type domain-containing protein n=1 Tax=Globodera pallida TaxID=36090 RepID=A0A183BVZ3_GLOPA
MVSTRSKKYCGATVGNYDDDEVVNLNGIQMKRWEHIGNFPEDFLSKFVAFVNMKLVRRTLLPIEGCEEDVRCFYRCSQWPTIECPVNMRSQLLICSGKKHYVVGQGKHLHCKYATNSRDGSKGQRLEAEAMQKEGDGKGEGRQQKQQKPKEATAQRIGKSEVASKETFSSRSGVFSYFSTAQTKEKLEEVKVRQGLEVPVRSYPRSMRCKHRRSGCTFNVIVRDERKANAPLHFPLKLFARNQHNHSGTNRNKKRVASKTTKQTDSDNDGRQSGPEMDTTENEHNPTENTGEDGKVGRQRFSDRLRRIEVLKQQKEIRIDEEQQDNEVKRKHRRKVPPKGMSDADGHTSTNGRGEPPLASHIIPSSEQRQQILTDWNQFLWSVRGIFSIFFFGLQSDRTTKYLAIDGARPMEDTPTIPVIEEPEDDDNDGERESGHSEDPSRFSVAVPHRDLPLEKLANALMLRLIRVPQRVQFSPYEQHQTKQNNSFLYFEDLNLSPDERAWIRVVQGNNCKDNDEIKKEHWLKVNRQLLTYAIMGKCSTVFK